MLQDNIKEVWQSGLSQNPAKIPCQVIGTVGSNPTTSVGELSEWLKESDCKSDGSAFTGSNPVPPTLTL